VVKPAESRDIMKQSERIKKYVELAAKAKVKFLYWNNRCINDKDKNPDDKEIRESYFSAYNSYLDCISIDLHGKTYNQLQADLYLEIFKLVEKESDKIRFNRTI